jgi:hypothetical protein
MILKKVVNPRILVGVILTAMALVAFNLGRPSGLKSDLLTSFNSWYQGTALKLTPDAELKDADLTLKVLVTLNDPARTPPVSTWELPSKSLRDLGERENTARVLQLIRESGVFGLTPLRSPAPTTPHVSLVVKEGERVFETAVSLDAVRENIQLMNLLKLLEVYSSTPASSELDPTRL